MFSWQEILEVSSTLCIKQISPVVSVKNHFLCNMLNLQDPKSTTGGQCQAIQNKTNWAYAWLESWPQEKSAEQADKQSSVLEAMRDLAVLEAMLHSSDNKGIPTSVKIDMNTE